MPLHVFDLPFPARIGPGLEQAREHNLAWLRAHGVLPDATWEQRYLTQQFAELAARVWPGSSGADLDLVLDISSWSAFFDDHVERLTVRAPEQVPLLCGALTALTHPGSPAPAAGSGALTASWSDAWARQTRGMSPGWVERAARSWRWFIDANAAETLNRTAGLVPDLPGYLRVRRRSCFMPVWMDLIERAGHFEVPEPVFASDAFQALRQAVVDACIVINDVHSLEKEEAGGDVHNIVTIARHHQHLTRQDAIAWALALFEERLAMFLRLREEVLRTARDTPGDEAAERYIDGLGSVARGGHDWDLVSSRYRGPA
ncbi:terpene synthase family protein [Streptomyces subrutilus]|uniref:terpene synthase family protein n=1 Tax=Streptomyces subrutilus TaxID=36818 RepID=UPI002E12D369|nr:hypothetical protein OG479_06600 [Streptomyces subrutilus]